jgi:hypothetical protein
MATLSSRRATSQTSWKVLWTTVLWSSCNKGSRRGYSTTREEAMADFKKQWLSMTAYRLQIHAGMAFSAFGDSIGNH